MTRLIAASGFQLGGFSISDNLLSGLVGGVLGGLIGLLGALIVVIAEGRRQRRQERAALRLLSFESAQNLHMLETVDQYGPSVTKFLSTAVWDAEQVRVASYLRFAQLGTVALPQMRLGLIVRYRDGWPEAQFATWLLGADGVTTVESAVAELKDALKVLEPKVMTWRRQFDRWRKKRFSKAGSP